MTPNPYGVLYSNRGCTGHSAEYLAAARQGGALGGSAAETGSAAKQARLCSQVRPSSTRAPQQEQQLPASPTGRPSQRAWVLRRCWRARCKVRPLHRRVPAAIMARRVRGQLGHRGSPRARLSSRLAAQASTARTRLGWGPKAMARRRNRQGSVGTRRQQTSSLLLWPCLICRTTMLLTRGPSAGAVELQPQRRALRRCASWI